jgi:hypothetical protein
MLDDATSKTNVLHFLCSYCGRVELLFQSLQQRISTNGTAPKKSPVKEGSNVKNKFFANKRTGIEPVSPYLVFFLWHAPLFNWDRIGHQLREAIPNSRHIRPKRSNYSEPYHRAAQNVQCGCSGQPIPRILMHKSSHEKIGTPNVPELPVNY